MFNNITWRSHQLKGASWLYARTGGILCFPTGQGKTLCSLLAASKALDRYSAIDKIIVFVPKNGLTSWIGDIEDYTEFDYCLFPDIIDNKDIIIIKHSHIRKFKNHITDDLISRSIFIVDEIDVFSNPETAMYKHAFEILKKSEILWGLTATPIHNDLEHLYHIALLLFKGKSPFGSLGQFQKQFIDYRSKKIWKKDKRQKRRPITIQQVVGHHNLDRLKDIISSFVYTSESNASICFKKLDIELSVEEEVKYFKVGRSLFEGDNKGDGAGPLMHALQKLVDGCFFEQDGAKLLRLEKMLGELFDRGNPFIVYVSYHEVRKRVTDVIKRNGFEVLTVTGFTSEYHRKKIVERIKSGGPCCIVMTKAGIRSINLQFCESTICFDTPMDIRDLIQLLGRQSRLGSPFDCNYVFFLSVNGTIDEYKSNYVMSNAKLVESVIKGTAVLPDHVKTISKEQVIKLRRKLLWGKRQRTATVSMQSLGT